MHLAVTKNVSTIKFYIDGVSSYTAASPPINTPTGNFHIAGNAVSNAEYLDGSIDEVRFWDHERSEVEIQAAMDIQLVGNESGLLSYHNFNEESGSVLPDLTANGNNGTLMNMDDTDWTLADGSENCNTLNVNSFNTTIISLFPNPVKDYFKIIGLQGTAYNVDIINLKGQIVKVIKNNKSESISLSTLSNGMYFVKISSDNSSKIIRIIKTN
jgi:hypothetical protein